MKKLVVGIIILVVIAGTFLFVWFGREDKIMKIESPSFENNGLIPSKFTCDSGGTSPELKISDVPEGAVSLVLIMEDPDVPVDIRPDGMFYHWLIWNIPADTKKISEGKVPEGVEGKNTAGKNGYIGPCPPDGEHRYFFKLYALDANLVLSPDFADKEKLIETMEGHVLEEAELIGRYKRR